MESGKIDRRRRYTLSVIREAFFALLAEVGFAKMTVADICRRADINRGTFYLHYEDKFALLGYLRVRRLRAPEKTIDSLKAARTVLPTGKSDPAQWDVAPGESTGKHSAKTLNR